MNALFAAVLGYLVGSISFAVVCSRVFRLPDPRTYGSRNPGATNVLRSGRRMAALLTLLGDAAKGAVVVLAVRAAGSSDVAIASAAVAAFLGHLWPLYFGFKGGKGVATAFGVLLSLSVVLAVAALVVFLLVVAIWRYVSLGSVLAGIAAAVAATVMYGVHPVSVAVALMSLLIVIRHRENLRRMREGQERRFVLRRRMAENDVKLQSASRDPNAAGR